MEFISIVEARRLALARAGLLKPAWTGMPGRARGRGKLARDAALSVIRRFGYLQLDTVSIAGARSHALVLMSRLSGMDASLAEELLHPGADVFEYWGHEASWMPMDLYPAFEFRRKGFTKSDWWHRIMNGHRGMARDLVKRIRDEGPLRSLDMEGRGSRGWWDLKASRRVAAALWSSGELAIRERTNFHRSFDLAERVIPDEIRRTKMSQRTSIEHLLLKALDGHGWATQGTLAQTWRLRNRQAELKSTLGRLAHQKSILPCELENPGGRPTAGWIRPHDLELAARLKRIRPRLDRGVLLSPFDPVLWDRARVRRLFGFDQVLEIFKPAPQRTYGYYCLPVLAGDELVARFDLKAHRKTGRLEVLSAHFETTQARRATGRAAAQFALTQYALALSLKPAGWTR
jgi:uncharacterized protein YcaQ